MAVRSGSDACGLGDPCASNACPSAALRMVRKVDADRTVLTLWSHTLAHVLEAILSIRGRGNPGPARGAVLARGS